MIPWLLSSSVWAAPEICNGFDDDGDGTTDEGPVAWYPDTDGDNTGDPAAPVWTAGCEVPAPADTTSDSSDCDDTSDVFSSSAVEDSEPNGLDEDCDGIIDDDLSLPNELVLFTDEDSTFLGHDQNRPWSNAASQCLQDGYHLATIDDDLENAVVYSALKTFEASGQGGDDWWLGFYESAADIWVWETGTSSYVNFAADQPNDSGLSCGAMNTETALWHDDDCGSNGPYVCEADCALRDAYLDADGDGLGDPNDLVPACILPAGRVWNGADCDDGDSSVTQHVWYTDEDGDGVGSDVVAAVDCEGPPNSSLLTGDCADQDDRRSPLLQEQCDEQQLDEDCDELSDDDDTDAIGQSLYWTDSDRDGYGTEPTRSACALPEGFTAQAGDCDDEDELTWPGAPELCDELDNDCDEDIDEDVVDQSWHPDEDGDGYGDATQEQLDCVPPDEGWVTDDRDCDDDNPDVHPGQTEIPGNPADEDCDGLAPREDLDGDGHSPPEDCDDSDPAVHPGAREDLSPADRDCDGLSDPTSAFVPGCGCQSRPGELRVGWVVGLLLLVRWRGRSCPRS